MNDFYRQNRILPCGECSMIEQMQHCEACPNYEPQRTMNQHKELSDKIRGQLQHQI